MCLRQLIAFFNLDTDGVCAGHWHQSSSDESSMRKLKYFWIIAKVALNKSFQKTVSKITSVALPTMHMCAPKMKTFFNYAQTNYDDVDHQVVSQLLHSVKLCDEH